ncbi:MAG: DNA repair protein RadA [Candidatus Aureabacteria bacterium]|nr:DNA repair protein RadA [Candidatus Auribacterota bacterium]
MKNSKARSVFVCQACGHESARWVGKCPGCGAWNSLEEEAARKEGKGHPPASGEPARRIGDLDESKQERTSTGIAEFDGLLGGGIVRGSFILIGGEPGIGKSTLMLQVAAALAKGGARVLYVSAEESFPQTKLRAQRIGAEAETLFILCEADIEAVIAEAKKTDVSIVVVDSIQIVYHPEIPSGPGSVNQVRGCAAALMRTAKSQGISIFIVGHVTKSGDIAGPRMLEHMVDTVLYFEGDRHQAYRVLRTRKNRFGSTEEVGIFSMGPGGLKEVGDPSRLFLQERRPENAGSVVTPAMEGTRPIMVEIQALVGARSFGVPQRRSLGVDYNRLCMLIAVLETRAGLSLRDRDVFVSVAGGLTVEETAIDLAIALALASSLRGASVAPDMIAIGEVGLGGELRGCQHTERRLREAGKLGFRRAILPRSSAGEGMERFGLKLVPCETVGEAIKAVVTSNAAD